MRGACYDGMGGTFSIARFPSNSLSTAQFRWLHENAWEDAHKSYFFSLSLKKLPLGILSPPPLVRQRRQRTSPEQGARYILDLPHGTPAAGLDIQVTFGSFTTLHVLISPLCLAGANSDWSSSTGRQALAFMISGAIIMSGADVVRLVPYSPLVEQQLVRLGWGRPRTIWTPWQEMAWLYRLKRGLYDSRGLMLQILELIPADWWLSADGIESHKSLGYLEKQQTMEQRAEQLATQPKRRPGIFSRLFYPKS